MSLNIVTEAEYSAPKLLLYGLAGSGKSTLASKLESPLFFDFEGGVKSLGVARSSDKMYKGKEGLDLFYEDLAEFYRGYKTQYSQFKTIVIDSVDWLMRCAVERAAGIDKYNLDETLNKSNGGYGNGKQVLENQVRTRLIPALALVNELGVTICLIAHADTRHVMDADGVNEDKVAPKIDVNTMNAFVEWVDEVFYLKKDDAGNRKVLVESDMNALAKNRLGLTGEFDISETDINELLKIKKGK